MGVLLVAGVALLASGAHGQAVPAPDPIDFCVILDSAYGTVSEGAPLEWIPALLGEQAVLLQGLPCVIADLNGPIEEDLPTPNGLLDGSFELGVLAELVNNPGAYTDLLAASGLDAAAVRQGFLDNYANLYSPEMHNLATVLLPSLWPLLQSLLAAEDPPIIIPDFSPEIQAAINALFPGLMQVMAGYATLGDEDSLTTTLTVAALLSLCDLITPGSCLINDIPTDPAAYTTFGPHLGPEGDADGDGYTNREEYEYFAGVVKDAAAYVEAALDPSINPGGATEGEGEGEGEGEAEIVIHGPAIVEEGDYVELRAVGDAGTYTWTKNGEVLTGETGSSLIIEEVVEADEGWYQVTVHTKGVGVSDPFFLEVVPAGSLPVTGGLGIALLASACALAGAIGIRRRK